MKKDISNRTRKGEFKKFFIGLGLCSMLSTMLVSSSTKNSGNNPDSEPKYEDFVVVENLHKENPRSKNLDNRDSIRVYLNTKDSSREKNYSYGIVENGMMVHHYTKPQLTRSIDIYKSDNGVYNLPGVKLKSVNIDYMESGSIPDNNWVYKDKKHEVREKILNKANKKLEKKLNINPRSVNF